MSSKLQTPPMANGATSDQEEGSWDQCDVLTTRDGRLWGAIGIVEKGRRRKNKEVRYPESAIWGAALYPLKHPVESYTEKGAKGKIRVLRVNNPKNDPYHPIIDVWDLAEAAAVRAILNQLLLKRIAGTTTRARNLTKTAEAHQREDGKWFYSRRKSVAYMADQDCPFSGSTLDRAQKKANPLLGHLLQTEEYPGWTGHPEKFNLKDDLDAMITKYKELSSVQENGHPFSTDGVCETIGVARMTLNKMLPDGAKTPETALGADGRVIKAKRIDAATVAAIAHYRNQPTIPQAAGILGVDRSVVDDLIGRGFLTVLPDPYGNQRNQRVDRRALTKLADDRTSDSDEALDISSDEDEDGNKRRWLPLSAIQIHRDQYPNASQKVLYKYANKSCPQLDGDKLQVQVFPPNPKVLPRPGRPRREPVMKWLETDLARLKCPKVGKPGQEMAKAIRASDSEREPNIRDYPDLGIKVDFDKKIVTGNERTDGFERSEVEWHILVTALRAHPNAYTLVKLKADYPVDYDQANMRMAKARLNRRLRRFNLVITETYTIKVLG